VNDNEQIGPCFKTSRAMKQDDLVPPILFNNVVDVKRAYEDVFW
jgi:hypothetical protein